MPTPAKGTYRFREGKGWDARLTMERNKRVSIQLVTCKPGDDEKAAERTEILAGIAKRMRAAGLLHLARPMLERAAGRDGQALADVLTAVERLCSGEAAAPINAATTIQEFGEQWTSGKLHERWPDHVKKKRSAEDDEERLRLYVYPLVGSIALPEFTTSHADLVMSSLPTRLSPSTRRHVAQVLARLLKLAAYPARLIHASPLPAGFLPPPGKRKALSFLYPDEDRVLLAASAVPLPYRVLYGFLAREGMRRSEAAALTWNDVDLERGAITLDKNKTDEPRAWALDAGVVRALAAWRRLRGEPGPRVHVFVDEGVRSVVDRNDGKGCLRLREHLQLAGIDRQELFERSPTRQPIRLHDLRATFITVSLANGRTETWVADRTGHTSSVMINRYRRAARRVSELWLGDLVALDDGIPELRSGPSPSPEIPPNGPGSGPDEADPLADPGRSEPSRTVATGVENPISSNEIAEAGLEPAHPFGQRILNPRHHASQGADPYDPRGSEPPDATVRDGGVRIDDPRVLIRSCGSRADLIRLLGAAAGGLAGAAGELAAAGDVHAAQVALAAQEALSEALRRLLGAPRAGAAGEVLDLAERRDRGGRT